MKKISTCALIVALAFATSLEAAELRVVTRESGDSLVHSLYLDGLTTADEATALSVSILPGDSAFENFNATGFDGTTQLGAADDFSFTNAGLSLPPVPFNGKGWTIIDGSDDVAPPSGPDGIGYAASFPGNFLDADDLLLNNIMLPRDAVGSAVVVLIGGDGNPIGEPLSSPLPIPEPTTLALAGLSMIGIVGLRRRS